MKKLLAAAITAVLMGCASVPQGPDSREAWEAIHVREIDGVTARQVQDAAEKVLRLADHDFTFQYPDGRLVASRNWMVYAVIAITGGKDHWTIETKEADGLTRVTTYITREMSTTTAAPVVGGAGVAPVTGSTPGMQIFQPAPYELFWERLSFALGKSDQWITCDQFKERISSTRKRDRHQIDALCSVTTDDNAPSP